MALGSLPKPGVNFKRLIVHFRGSSHPHEGILNSWNRLSMFVTRWHWLEPQRNLSTRSSNCRRINHLLVPLKINTHGVDQTAVCNLTGGVEVKLDLEGIVAHALRRSCKPNTEVRNAERDLLCRIRDSNQLTVQGDDFPTIRTARRFECRALRQPAADVWSHLGISEIDSSDTARESAVRVHPDLRHYQRHLARGEPLRRSIVIVRPPICSHYGNRCGYRRRCNESGKDHWRILPRAHAAVESGHP
jgi:hypothetical protein